MLVKINKFAVGYKYLAIAKRLLFLCHILHVQGVAEAKTMFL
jgi:hypothetical protein